MIYDKIGSQSDVHQKPGKLKYQMVSLIPEILHRGSRFDNCHLRHSCLTVLFSDILKFLHKYNTVAQYFHLLFSSNSSFKFMISYSLNISVTYMHINLSIDLSDLS